MSQNYCIKLKKNKPNDLTKHNYSSKNITDCYNLLVNRHINLHRNLFFKTIEQLELENKARAFLSSRRLEKARATRVLGTALVAV